MRKPIVAALAAEFAGACEKKGSGKKPPKQR
jgi:hypothetical protein